MEYILVGLGAYLLAFGTFIRFIQVVRRRDAFMHDAQDRWLNERNQNPPFKEVS
jgi:hypothetical protein